MTLPKERGIFSLEHKQALGRFIESSFYPELRSRAAELRRNGDNTAGLFVTPDPSVNSYIRVMVRSELFFNSRRDLSKNFFKDQTPLWISKGVGVLVGPQDEMRLGFTGNFGWCNVDALSELTTVQGRNKYSTIGKRVDLALNHAQPYQDFRFGSGLISALHLRWFGSNWRSIPVL